LTDPSDFTDLSRHNFNQAKGTTCGCYYCLNSVNGSDITETCDGGLTAICPECGIDSLLPDIVDESLLAKGYEMWFTSNDK